jgi:hypothetical protein
MEGCVAYEGKEDGFKERSEESSSCACHRARWFFSLLVSKGNIFFRGMAIYIYDWLAIRLTKPRA